MVVVSEPSPAVSHFLVWAEIPNGANSIRSVDFCSYISLTYLSQTVEVTKEKKGPLMSLKTPEFQNENWLLLHVSVVNCKKIKQN